MSRSASARFLNAGDRRRPLVVLVVGIEYFATELLDAGEITPGPQRSANLVQVQGGLPILLPRVVDRKRLAVALLRGLETLRLHPRESEVPPRKRNPDC